MRANIKILLIIILCISHQVCLCQNNATTVVKSFGESMRKYYVNNEDAYFEKINNIVTGNYSCRVRDKIASDISIYGSKENSITIDTYLNIFEKWSMSNLNISMQNIRHIPCVEPTYSNTNVVPIQLVSANFQVRNDDVNYNINNIYAVRGNNITWIEDEKSYTSLSYGLSLYNKGDYNRAFQIFRDLAYNANNEYDYDARYYTIIMEAKKEGCDNIHSKPRDIEAAWLCIKDVVLCGFNQRSTEHPIVKLANSLSADVKKLPLGNTSWSFLLLYMPPFNKGLMISVNKKGLYGYVDIQNKIKIEYQYDLASSFNDNGLALVMHKNKLGYINEHGNYIIPNEYDNAYPFFKKNRTFAIKNNTLCLITEDNHIVRKRSGYTSIIGFNYQEDYVCVCRDDQKIDVLDFNGDYVHKDYDNILIDYPYIRLSKKGNDEKVDLRCKFF